MDSPPSIGKAGTSSRNTRIYYAVFFAHNGTGPFTCFFCNEGVSPPWETVEKRGDQFFVHHRDFNHDNNDPSNLVASHSSCHAKHHLNPSWGWGWKNGRAFKKTPAWEAAHKKLMVRLVKQNRTPEHRKLVSEARKREWANMTDEQRMERSCRIKEGQQKAAQEGRIGKGWWRRKDTGT